MRPARDDDGFCFVCGPDNHAGLRLTFRREDGKTKTTFTPQKIHQGYKGITHGGIIASVLDEAIIHAALADGMTPVTAELTIRFRAPLMVGEETIVEAETTKRRARIVEAVSRLIRRSDGCLIAEARAKLILH
ncbi:MAG TPA: PaaI family thioesterase [Dissulfurispiraceae bacterium]|nr:PaaI family thioesterase [Dissulfurispiraceae bacterium]